jgi:hypothetical protein
MWVFDHSADKFYVCAQIDVLCRWLFVLVYGKWRLEIGYVGVQITRPHGVINRGNKILIFTATEPSICMLLFVQNGRHNTFTEFGYFLLVL